MFPKPTMQAQISLDTRRNALLEFINNTSQDENKIKEIIDHIKEMAKVKYQLNFECQSQKFCALSGQEITNDNFVIIDGYTFNQQMIHQYFMRDGKLDISIGDIEFYSFQDGESKHVSIPLTYEILETIYGVNLESSIDEAQKFYSQRLNDPVTFVCKQTGKEHVISDRIKINGDDVSIYWAIQNINQLKEPERSYVESCKNNYPTVSQITQSMRFDNINSSQNFGISQRLDQQYN